jgi:hypothetical protein
MIGSFGCNELAPDILGFLDNLTSEKTRFIPQKFKSFIEPIGSQPLVNQVVSVDIPMVCTPRNYHFLQHTSHECFHFDHGQQIQLEQ